jgi:hypothetical protein
MATATFSHPTLRPRVTKFRKALEVRDPVTGQKILVRDESAALAYADKFATAFDSFEEC